MKTHSLPLRIFCAGVLFLAASLQAKSLDRVLAVVGTEPILQSEVEDRLALIKKSPVYSNILGIDVKTINADTVLESMIEEKILAAVTDELKASVSDADVQKQIDSIAKQNNITRKSLENSLRSEGIPFDAYASNIRLQLQKRTIFERELRATGGVGETEMRSLYLKRATREYQLIMLEAPAKQQSAIVKGFKANAAAWDELAKKYPTTELGWTNPTNLKADLAKSVRTAQKGSLIGPHRIGKTSALIYIADERVGSEEEYERMKEQLAGELQSQGFTNRFQSWLDAKKKEMHIVVNK